MSSHEEAVGGVDDLAAVWVDDDRGFDVDAAVNGAVDARRGGFVAVFASVVGCVVAAAAAVSFDDSFLAGVVVAAAVVVAAVAVVVHRAAGALQRLSGDPLAALGAWRRVRFASGVGVVVAVDLAVVVLVFVTGHVDSAAGFGAVVVVAAAVAAAVRADRHAVPLFRWAAAHAAPEPAQLVSAPPAAVGAAVGDGPATAASAIATRGFSVAPPGDRRGWRVVVALTALCVVPLLVDALAVIGLGLGPQPSGDGQTFHTPLLHLVLPWLPLVVSTLTALLTPLAFLGATVAAPGFARRFTWLALVPVLGIPAGISFVTAVFGGDDLNAHLWGYSFSNHSLVAGLDDGCSGDCSFFFLVTVVATLTRALGTVAVVVAAVGLWRAVGRGRLRAAVTLLCVGDLALWLLTFFFAQRPQELRAAGDLVVAVGLLLVAVLSQPAFDERGR